MNRKPAHNVLNGSRAAPAGHPARSSPRLKNLPAVLALCLLCAAGCAHVQTRTVEATAYCGCKQCCSWGRGSWKYLKLNFWNRYYRSGPDAGRPYHGKTARGTDPRQYYPGLFSVDSLRRPWVIPFRIVFFPWLLFEQPGTIAADTTHYPFGTIMEVPGYGSGVVEDRGSAIKGPRRIDLFYDSHRQALQWGRRSVAVEIKEK